MKKRVRGEWPCLHALAHAALGARTSCCIVVTFAVLAIGGKADASDLPPEHAWIPAESREGRAKDRLTAEQWLDLKAGPMDFRPLEVTERDRMLLAEVVQRNAAAVEKALAGGANPNARDAATDPALVVASRLGDHHSARLLLRAGAAPDLKGAQGFRALALAALRGHARVVEMLLAAGATVDARSDNGATALLTAAGAGRTAIAGRLLDAGADWTLYNRDGLDALGIAAAEGHTSVLDLLLDRGADPNRLDRTARPPLYWAVYRKQREAVRVLLSRGAEAGTIAYDIFPRAFTETELQRR